MKHVLARFIRIHPVSWVGHVCMRVDIRSRGMYNATTESVYSKTTRNETVEKSSKVVICFLKILWQKYLNQILLKSQGRSTPLGIQKQKLNNSAMTASSHAGPGNEPWRARLAVGFQSETWRAGEDNSQQYLQIDLGTSHNITQVATQGSHVMNDSCWVTQYNLSYSLDGSSWELYIENETAKVAWTILFLLKFLTCSVFLLNF